MVGISLFLKDVFLESSVLYVQLKGDAMNLTLMLQNNMLGVHLGFSYNHALFWCQWLSMDEINLLGWSLNMTSTCLEHKTRIT